MLFFCNAEHSQQISVSTFDSLMPPIQISLLWMPACPEKMVVALALQRANLEAISLTKNLVHVFVAEPDAAKIG